MPQVRYIGYAALEARAVYAMTSAVMKAAEDLQGRAQAETPVRTGTLKASIHVEGPEVSGRTVSAKVATGGEASEYAIAVHEGIGPFTIEPVSAKALYWPGAAHPVKRVNHPGFSGRKYIERPLLSMIPTYQALIAAASRIAF